MEVNDCLVTKLKSTVDNSELEKLNHMNAGYLRPTEGFPKITIKSGEKVTLTTRDGGSSVTLTGTGEEQYFDWSPVSAGTSVYIDISNILNVISFDPFAFNYNIGKFWSYRTETTLVRTNNLYSSGTIEDLGKLILLTELNISSNFSIRGEIKTLASKQVENGRVSGTLTIYYSSSRTSITYNGERPTGNHISIRFGTSMTDPTETDTENGYQIVTFS